MSRQWLRFGLALALAVGVALAWGWVGHQRVDPAPAHQLGPGETLRFRGVELSDPVLTAAEPSPQYAEELPAGALVARLEFTVTVVEDPPEADAHYCQVELLTDEGTYLNDLRFAVAEELPHTCDSDKAGEPLTAGDSQRVTAAWVVPKPPGEDAVALVRFLMGPVAVEVHPA